MVRGSDLAMRLLCPYCSEKDREYRRSISSFKNLTEQYNRWKNKWPKIIEQTTQHAQTLASFATIYKSLLYLFKILRCFNYDSRSESSKSSKLSFDFKKLKTPSLDNDVLEKKNPIDSLIAGTIGGYFIFGKKNGKFTTNMTEQIVLYVFSRVIIATGKITAFKLGEFLNLLAKAKTNKSSSIISKFSNKQKVIENTIDISYALFSSIVWGSVMYLHRSNPNFLQKSMATSMDYIYNDSNNWNGFYNFLFEKGGRK